MTPTELKTARKALGLSAERFARLVHVHSGRTVRRWEAGDCPIPGTISAMLKLYDALQEIANANPHPKPGECVRLTYDERALERIARQAINDVNNS